MDWLLDEKQGWEDLAGTGSAPVGGESLVICKNWHWYLSGGIVAGVGVLGMVAMGILSSLFPVVLTETPAGVEWTRVYTGLMAFLKGNDVEWLFALWAAVALVGFWLLAQPSLRQRQERPGQSGFTPVCGGDRGSGIWLRPDCLVGPAGEERRHRPAGALSGSSDLLRGAAALKAGTGAS